MNILRYQNFLSESVMIDIILESKLIYSASFLNIIKSMDNKIANHLYSIYDKDIDSLIHNFIDVSDRKDQVIFTNDKKAQEFISEEPGTWKVINDERYLTHSESNKKIFDILGYKAEGSPWTPSVETLGEIIAEAVSPITGRTYVIFKELNIDDPRQVVINKEALVQNEGRRVWGHSRNPVNIGKLVRAILKASDFTFNDKELETFVNIYKSTFDFMKDSSKRFDIVSGRDISYWYDKNNYYGENGTLNGSCMAEVPSSYFSIYMDNPEIKLVILYDDNGKINSDGKYTSDKIKGRAILWNCKLNSTKIKFLDRIYTTQDSDVELFKKFAQENGWWYKTRQNYVDEPITDGSSVKNSTLIADLSSVDHYQYPYMDTLYNLNLTNRTASNKYDINEEIDDEVIECRDTEGGYITIDGTDYG